METVLLVIGIAAVILLAALIVIVLLSNKNKVDEQYLARQISADISRQQSELRQELTAQTQNSVGAMGGMLEQRLQGFAAENQRSLNSIRDTVEKRLNEIQTDNARQLDEMRSTVDEKLNKSLDEKFSNSFSLVSQRLEQVYKGLGEMQNLAVGVGDLKKVLSNVKTRGILGEIQLGSILAEILSPTQYEENAATKQGSRNRVEFAVKLPADEGGFIYLPIDSKFPGDTYLALRDAVESGDKAQIEVCEKALLGTIRNEAKDIHDKYIDPPHTTDFAVMFLPFEGLYSEVVNRGMVEELQHKYKVSIAGPSTMAALLNALQMGFRTLAVQKRSAEVWDVLRSVKKEFDSFADVLEKTQTRLDQANKELDNLVGVRTRQMQKQLAKVGTDEGIEN
ncbi:DNA recombination protein RmuC [uncultured Ruminococcus sp.]|jgi:DNA recombination protein RmuC|uniref:DNA recombination protein RmuC n=2 Tax=unclassified Ruminococcus TaxID=2608920 RepID=UPI00292D6F93|nr:DNA recombination protein RmuC [uncultured Ruminococcus sp.]MBQ4173119.1 DNA recombination protein RmuC [Ruminococcus sp.]MBR0337064.1 DNA recombination protein RmuC [Ruminococcus sp.]MEE0843789.1 DNA recombination protein RmuC [Ruminococcus sp.]MEE3474793.1 DNA recombination protein RmuC [Ruminococcus sp.]